MNVYERVVADLMTKTDPQYKIFNDKITKSKTESLGVRMPDVKKIAKSADKSEIEEYLAECKFSRKARRGGILEEKGRVPLQVRQLGAYRYRRAGDQNRQSG